METTIRAHLHDAPVDIHNERDEELIAKENAKRYKIDPNGDYEQWMAGKERDAYEVIFGDALAKYNAKQKRKDRQMTIDDYIESVKSDTRGRVKKADRKKGITKRVGKASSYELVVSVGNVAQAKDADKHTVRNQDGSRLMPKRIDPKINKDIQRVYWEGFQQRNPNLKLYAVDYHGDEVFRDKIDKKFYPGTEHSHGRFIPVAGGYKQGLEVQSSMGKALAGMGFYDHYEDLPNGDRKWVCAYSAWTAREAEVLEEITKQFIPDIEFVHPYKGLGLEGKETEAYQAEQDLETAIVNARVETQYLQESIDNLRAQKEAMLDEMEQIDIELVDKRNDRDSLTTEIDKLRDERNSRISDLTRYNNEVRDLSEDKEKARQMLAEATRQTYAVDIKEIDINERARDVVELEKKVSYRIRRADEKDKKSDAKSALADEKYNQAIAFYDAIQVLPAPPLGAEEYMKTLTKTLYKTKSVVKDGVRRDVFVKGDDGNRIKIGDTTAYDEWLEKRATYQKAVAAIDPPPKTNFAHPFDTPKSNNSDAYDLEL